MIGRTVGGVFVAIRSRTRTGRLPGTLAGILMGLGTWILPASGGEPLPTPAWRQTADTVLRDDGHAAADASLQREADKAQVAGRTPLPYELERLDQALGVVLDLVATDPQRAATLWDQTVQSVVERLGSHPRRLLVEIEVGEACVRLGTLWAIRAELGDEPSGPLALEALRQGRVRLTTATTELRAATRAAESRTTEPRTTDPRTTDPRTEPSRATLDRERPADGSATDPTATGNRVNPADAGATPRTRWWDDFASRGGPFTREETRRLAIEIDLRAALIERVRADLFPPESLDRVAALTAAREPLQRLVANLPDGSARNRTVRLDLARVMAELGESALAQELIASVPETTNADQASEVALAAAEIALLAGNDRQARTIRAEVPESVRARRPEWAIVGLSLAVQTARAATAARDARTTATARDEARTLLRDLSDRFGPVWAYRGRSVILDGGGTEVGDPVTTDRLAVAAWEAGQSDRAVELWTTARDQALRLADGSAALACGRKAGLVRQRQGRHDQAATLFRETALAVGRHPDAATVHLAAAWNLAQRLSARESDTSPNAAPSSSVSPRLREYETTLLEHIVQFPDGPTINTARDWLARLAIQARQPRRATDTLLEAEPSQPGFEAVAKRLRTAIAAERAASREVGVPFTDRAEELASELAVLLARWPDEPPPPWPSPPPSTTPGPSGAVASPPVTSESLRSARTELERLLLLVSPESVAVDAADLPRLTEALADWVEVDPASAAPVVDQLLTAAESVPWPERNRLAGPLIEAARSLTTAPNSAQSSAPASAGPASAITPAQVAGAIRLARAESLRSSFASARLAWSDAVARSPDGIDLRLARARSLALRPEPEAQREAARDLLRLADAVPTGDPLRATARREALTALSRLGMTDPAARVEADHLRAILNLTTPPEVTPRNTAP